MKRFWKTVSIALICVALASPQIDARGRNNNGNNRSVNVSASQSGKSRPNANKSNAPKPSNNNSRPGGNHVGNNNTSKPGNNNAHPGGNYGNNKPAKPNYGHANHKAPNHNNVVRPHCPPARPYYRPTPPPTFRPYNGCPVLRSVFSITFGTAIDISRDYLNRHSYNVYHYGNDVIYLRNVTENGYVWPDATLYFDAHGLTGSQFIYSTNYNNRSRYNNVYNTLYNQYGAPISMQNTNNGVIATWWGYDGQYISLEYSPNYTNNGQLRYFTTLSFGI